jgi:hypothetical protein
MAGCIVPFRPNRDSQGHISFEYNPRILKFRIPVLKEVPPMLLDISFCDYGTFLRHRRGQVLVHDLHKRIPIRYEATATALRLWGRRWERKIRVRAHGCKCACGRTVSGISVDSERGAYCECGEQTEER